MDLVNELQVSAEQDDVLTVLRKARRVASKLRVSNIDEWLRSELEGYASRLKVPRYRMLKGTLCFDSNGPIPAGFNMLRTGIIPIPGEEAVEHGMSESIGEIYSIIDETSKRHHGIYVTLGGEEFVTYLRRRLHPMLADRAIFMLELSIPQVRAIPESVKDRILDWALELERKGIRGDNMTFSSDERKLAHEITFNITGSSIGQLNNMGNNIQGG